MERGIATGFQTSRFGIMCGKRTNRPILPCSPTQANRALAQAEKLMGSLGRRAAEDSAYSAAQIEATAAWQAARMKCSILGSHLRPGATELAKR